MSDTIKYIIEALRNKPIPSGIDYPNGHPRRIAGSPIKSARDNVNYTKYVRQQHEIGDTPVTYEEWLK